MDGSIVGIIFSFLFILAFQFGGLIISFAFLKNKPKALKLLIGSVLGSVSMQWMPVILSFFLGFNALSNVLGLAVFMVFCIIICLKNQVKLSLMIPSPKKISVGANLVVFIGFIIFTALTLHSFRFVNSAIYSSQCTYGDMSMHLGFITSIANQGVFPPDYSILAGTKLSYPFLSDSISSSLYVLGAPLSLAYFLPMLIAGLQVFCGFIIFCYLWLKDRTKTILAFILFFFCGGFGFFYFLSQDYSFSEIFTGFYTTPTNLINENIRWVNVIVDMLVPQRATLFGWAVLFAALSILYYGIKRHSRRCFVFTAILGGCLPMIHTHSFLALALVSAMWLLMDLIEKSHGDINDNLIKWCFALMPLLFMIIGIIVGDNRDQNWLAMLPGVFISACFFFGIFLVIKDRGSFKALPRWAVYLGITLVLALPQLITWTFQQAQGSQFTRAHFNWANLGDNYLWFYIKNLGITAVLFLPAVISANRSIIRTASPILLIMVVSETLVFQPNEYDNNKLIYVAYIFLCGMVASFVVDFIRSFKNNRIKLLAYGITIFLCSFSGVLTMAREAVAEYELIGSKHLNAAYYVEENTEPSAVFLTGDRHNNAIAALTGRNIVCGSSAYLYFHGLSFSERKNDVTKLYEQPQNSQDIIHKYGIDYILISEYERGSYEIDEEYYYNNYSLVYEDSQILIFKI